MFELLKTFFALFLTLVNSAFGLYKELIKIQNNFWAIALGVSPFVITIMLFVLKRIKSVGILIDR